MPDSLARAGYSHCVLCGTVYRVDYCPVCKMPRAIRTDDAAVDWLSLHWQEVVTVAGLPTIRGLIRTRARAQYIRRAQELIEAQTGDAS